MTGHRLSRIWSGFCLFAAAVILVGTLGISRAEAFRFVFFADSRSEGPHHVQDKEHQADKAGKDKRDLHKDDQHHQKDAKQHAKDSHQKPVAEAAGKDGHCHQNDYINNAALKELTQEIKKHHPEFVIFGGDMAWRGGKKNLEDWQCIVREGLGHIRLYVAIGNHELYGHRGKNEKELQKEYQEVFHHMPSGHHPPGYDKLAYAFHHGDSVFVVLDAYHHSSHKADVSKEQREWADKALHGAKHKFVISHAPAHPLHAADVDKESMKKLWEDLEKHNVNLFLAGHEHLYHRSKHGKITQVIAGNAGASKPRPYNFVVVDVHHDSITVTSYGGHHGNYHIIDGPFKP
jgi:predicted MPP superfamily phosphohydrolase